jgi:hypothetical protein
MQPKAGQPAVARSAWTLCGLSVALAVASVALAALNGTSPWQLVVEHLGVGAVSAASFPVIGALIVPRQPRNWFGWLLLVYGVVLGTFVFTQQYALVALGLSPVGWSLPGGELTSWLAAWTNLPGIGLGSAALVLLFPDGHLPSRRWRPLAWAVVAAIVVPTGAQAALNWPLRGAELARDNFVGTTETTDAVLGISLLLAEVLAIPCVVALVLRFRRARGVLRQQIKWFAYGGIISLPLQLSVPISFTGAFPESLAAVLEFLTVPILGGAIAVAMLRYRLYDIDRILNRTLVYALLTAALAGVYAVGVLVVGQAFTAGREPTGLVVAATTLTVAAIFQPLRRRIQDLVDRRFNRRRYDAARTIEGFSARLRQQTDLDALTADLVAVVDQTMQPTQATLWLRPGRHR